MTFMEPKRGYFFSKCVAYAMIAGNVTNFINGKLKIIRKKN